MTISDQILSFYQSLSAPRLSDDIEILNPYVNSGTWQLVRKFYHKYYDDNEKRTLVFGINPGRFGGGITGIPFTDPIHLATSCAISNPFEQRHELSSKFIYEMIDAFGGPEEFYRKYYITAVSPLGYTKNGKNLNYYDIPGWKTIFYNYALNMIYKQLPFIRQDLAVCIGQGQNLKFLEQLNNDHQLFERIITVPHPRWIMQYRLKRKKEFIQEYLDKLTIR